MTGSSRSFPVGTHERLIDCVTVVAARCVAVRSGNRLRGPMPGTVYKVCPAVEWEQAKSSGLYHGSPDDLRDGFIHLSTPDQLAGTLHKHFGGAAGMPRAGLVVIAFDADAFGPELKWEPARDGALFPHLYGPLETSLALSELPLEVDSKGRHVIAGGLA